MSTSSTTACSRSPSPATPESDTLEPAGSPEVIDAWCHALPPDVFLVSSQHQFGPIDKDNAAHTLKLEDIMHSGAFDDPTPAAPVMSTTTLKSTTTPYLYQPAGVSNTGSRSSVSSTKPVPPPPSQVRREPAAATMQCVVYPPKESCSNLPIMFPSLPESGTKSRVETQVRLTVDLAHASSSSGESLKYDRVGSWKWLRLPKGTSTKRRTRKEGKVDAPIEDTLFLTTEVTCASPPHTKVTCCTSCQAREAKRIERKIAARIRPARSDDECLDDVAIIPGLGKHVDETKLIQFNCPEVLDFSAGSMILPIRITCYCRHHREKTGFNVHFTMLDCHGRIVGSGTTRPIMITDDHKSTGVNKSATGSVDGTPNPDWPFHPLGDGAEVPMPATTITTKRKGGRSETGVERTKKRTKPYDGRRSGKISRRGSQGSLGSPVPILPSPGITSAFISTRPSTPALSQGTSSPPPFPSTEPATPDMSDRGATADLIAGIFDTLDASAATPSDNASGQAMFSDIPMSENRDIVAAELSFDALAAANFLTPEQSQTLPLTLPPPESLAVPSPMPFVMFNDPPPPIPIIPLPKIHRLIPAAGPTFGGIEITILGANFHPAMQLNCVFGDVCSSQTTRWSDNTLLCLLPPSTGPGVVAVSFQGVPKADDGSPPVLFTYTDETDKALMELALQVVGMKMTGKIEEAREVAMRIVTNTGGDTMGNAMNVDGTMQLSSGPAPLLDIRRLLLSRANNTGDFQQLILDFLMVIDAPGGTPAHTLSDFISHATPSGQTLLHLACLLGFSKVVRFLLDHGIDVDARDKNGYTALHFASLSESQECAKLLLDGNASRDIVNALGKTAQEIAPATFFKGLDDSCDEDAFADGEDDESEREAPVRSVARRRSDRRLAQWRDRPIPMSTLGDSSADEQLIPNPPVASKISEAKNAKEAEARIVDEKQVAASIMETVHRTLAQLQYPQGMMPNIPLHLPNLPGMPAWGVLPQMPAVFPVFVPIPTLGAIWGDKRNRVDQEPGVSDSEERSARNQPWLGIPTAQEWKSMWEKWIITARSNPNDEAPPAYTPREGEEARTAEKSEAKAEGISPHASSSSAVLTSRRVGYEQAVPVPEHEVKAYGYRHAKKQPHKTQKKHDPMLILFWLPILLLGLIWMFMHSVRVGFEAVKTILAVKTGIHA